MYFRLVLTLTFINQSFWITKINLDTLSESAVSLIIQNYKDMGTQSN